MDILVLLDCFESDVRSLIKNMSAIASDIGLENIILVSMIIRDKIHLLIIQI